MRSLAAFAIALLVGLTMAMSTAAAKGGGGGRACKPGRTFDDCYEKCLSRTGGASRKEYQKCAKRCANKGCPA